MFLYPPKPVSWHISHPCFKSEWHPYSIQTSILNEWFILAFAATSASLESTIHKMSSLHIERLFYMKKRWWTDVSESAMLSLMENNQALPVKLQNFIAFWRYMAWIILFRIVTIACRNSLNSLWNLLMFQSRLALIFNSKSHCAVWEKTWETMTEILHIVYRMWVWAGVCLCVLKCTGQIFWFWHIWLLLHVFLYTIVKKMSQIHV